LEAICRFESVACEVPLADIYDRVTFGAGPSPADRS
jgi:hypothetical protein